MQLKAPLGRASAPRRCFTINTEEENGISIGNFIDHILRTRNLSAKELTELLGYGSRTSLTRLRSGSCSTQAVESFSKKIRQKLILNTDEKKILDRIIYGIRSGDSDAAYEMEEFINADNLEEQDVFIIDAAGSQTLRCRYDNVKIRKIAIFNSIYVPMYRTLRGFIQRDDCRIDHYSIKTTDVKRHIHFFTATLPVIYSSNYSGYIVAPKGEITGILSSDVMLIAYDTEDGRSLEELILFTDKQKGTLMCTGLSGQIPDLIDIHASKCTPVKKSYFKSDSMRDYAQYCEEYAQLESNCAKCIIKPDLCVAMMPLEVITPAFTDKCPVDKDTLKGLQDIFARRYASIYSEGKPVNLLLKRNALEKMMETGRCRDHFWGMRDFTPKERVALMENLLWHEENNRFFNIYLFKDDDKFKNIQIDLYEGKGLAIFNAESSYDLKSHSDILITDEAFLKQFKEYFLNHLLKYDVMPKDETIEALKTMIHRCKWME